MRQMIAKQIGTAFVHIMALSALVVCLLVSSPVLHQAEAGLLSSIAKLGKGAKAAKSTTALGVAGIAADSAGFIKLLPDSGPVRPLALEFDEAGKAALLNKDGVNLLGDGVLADPSLQIGSFSRALQRGAESRSPALYISDADFFAHGSSIDALRKSLGAGTELHVIVRRRHSVRLLGRGEDSSNLLFSSGERLIFEAADLNALDAAVFRLKRSFSKAELNLLSLGTNQPLAGTAARAADRGYGSRALPVPIYTSEANLLATLKSNRRRTNVLVGEIRDGALHYGSGRQAGNIPLPRLQALANEADANLMVVDTAAPLQPGTKGLFGREQRIKQLDAAFAAEDYDGFLKALAPEDGGYKLTPNTYSDTHFGLALEPVRVQSAGQMAEDGRTFLSLTAEVALHGAFIIARTQDHEDDWDRRYFSDTIPGRIQMVLVISFAAGVVSMGVAWSWWRRIVPAPPKGKGLTRFLFNIARWVRLLSFVFLFLPLMGWASFVFMLVRLAYKIITWPLRALVSAARRKAAI